MDGSIAGFMIGWLQGTVLDSWSQGAKAGVVLNCAGVGYEIQLTPRLQGRLANGETVELWIHHTQREDATVLYGFADKNERELFRRLISVSGVGPQVGLALLQDCGLSELIRAITAGDLRRLSKAQGVGKRTAERLAVELRTALTGLDDQQPGLSLVEGLPETHDDEQQKQLSEVEQTLASLGYEDLEIRRALRAVHDQNDNERPKPDDLEAWLKQCLQWLSRQAG